jgi:HK97 family phage portal protein
MIQRRKDARNLRYVSPRSDSYSVDTGRKQSSLRPNDQSYSLAYKSISDVFACVNLRAETISQMEIKVVRIGTDIPLRNTPWHIATQYAMEAFEQDLMYLIEYALSIWGETFLYKIVQDDQHTPGGLQWLNPSSTERVVEDGFLIGFEYSGGDGQMHDFLRRQVAYYHYRDSDDDNAGLPPMRAALDAGNIKRNSQAFIEGFFANDATVGGIITGRSQSNAYGGSTVPLTKADRDKMITQWNSQTKGARKGFKTILLPWDLLYTKLGGEPPTAQIELTSDQRRNIHQVFRVPMSMTQAADASDPLSSGNTITADEAKFLSGWAIPEHKALLKYLNTKVMPWLAPGYELVGDYTDIMGMISDTAERRDMLRADLNAGAITVNQYRQKIGDELLPDAVGEVLYVPSGAIVTPIKESITIESPTPAPAAAAPQLPAGESLSERQKRIIDQMNRAMIDVYTATQLLGQTPTEELRGMYWVGNQLVPQDQLVNIWKYGTLIAPSTTNADLIVESDPEALPTDEDVDTLSEPESPTPPAEPNEARALILAEFEIWKKYVTRRIERGEKSWREFNVECIPDEWANEVRAQLTSTAYKMDEVETVFANAIKEHKTAQSRLLEFERKFRAWMNAMEKGTISGASGRRRLSNDWRVSGTQMYTEGLIDGGRLDGKITKQERRQLNKLVTQATPFIRKLGDNLAAGNLSKKQKEQRVTSWGQTFMQFYQDGLVAANKNKMLLFTGKDGSENCRTCKVLKGQVHTAGEWKERELRPGIDHHNFECGTWENCHHILTPTNGKAKGTLPDAETIRTWAAKVCTHNHIDDAPPLEEQPYTIEQYDAYWDTNGHDPEMIGVEHEFAINTV